MTSTQEKVLYVPVLGGLCSGKSTAVRYLAEQYPGIKMFGEAAADVLKRHGLENGWQGAKSEQIVREIAEAGLSRLESIAKGAEGPVVVEESGILGSLAHLAADGYTELQQEYAFKVAELLKAVKAIPFFINVPSEVAWRRREPRYREQTKSYVQRFGGSEESIMEGLSRRMTAVYSSISHLAREALDPPAVEISNSEDGSEVVFLDEVKQQFQRLAYGSTLQGEV